MAEHYGEIYMQVYENEEFEKVFTSNLSRGFILHDVANGYGSESSFQVFEWANEIALVMVATLLEVQNVE